jgi:hypothetical protein
VDDSGWIAELKIPFSQLRFGKEDEQTWGLQVGRRLYRHQEWSFWQYISPNASGFVSKFGDLRGLRNIRPRRQVEIMPFILGGYESYEKEDGNPFRPGNEWFYNAGVDGKIGISNNFILDFTINPDFGQVEADPSEVNLTTYETYFQERRPFFIEGKNLLDFKIIDDDGPMARDVLFYSRRVGKPPSVEPELEDNEYADVPVHTTILGAFKVTGKTSDGWSVGIMNSVTQEEQARIDREGDRREETVEPLTNYFASRIMKDFNKANSHLGFSFTMVNRRLGDEQLIRLMNRNACAAGIDFRHQWKDKTYFVDGSFVYSQVNGSHDAMTELQNSAPKYFQRPDARHLRVDSVTGHLRGTGGAFRIGKQGNSKWQYAFTLTHRSPSLETNDAGFLGKGDILRELIWLTFRQTEPVWIFRNVEMMWVQSHAISFGWERKYSQFMYSAETRLMNYWGCAIDMMVGAPWLEVNELRGGPALFIPSAFSGSWHIGSDYRKKVNGYFGSYLSRNFNKEARYMGFFGGLEIRPVNALNFDLELEYAQNYDLNMYVDNELEWTEPRYIRSRFDQKEISLQLRATFNITPDFTIQYYGMPFLSSGRYSDFGYITDSKARELTDRIRYYSPDQLSYDDTEEEFRVDENGDGNTSYSFTNPDFNVFDFNSNLVLRWEYRAGSVLYIVWTQNRYDWSGQGSYRLNDNLRDLFKLYPHNVFMVKLSYRFGV